MNSRFAALLALILGVVGCGRTSDQPSTTAPNAVGDRAGATSADTGAPPPPPSDAAGGEGPTGLPPEPPPALPLPPCARTVPVASSVALHGALAAAVPGDCIVLADGNYAVDTITQKGTANAPIVISAEHRGKAVVASGKLALDGAAYVVISGLLYSSGQGVTLSNCDHCRVSRSIFRIQETGPVSWIQINGATGGFNRVDHNDLGPKTHQGNLIGVYGAGQNIIQHTQIDHNLFHDVGPVTSNGWETIRAGLSGLSHSSGFIVIEHNLFRNTQGDPEIISTKSCDNMVRYNTLRTSKGQISIRIGSRNAVYGNYILGGGVTGTGGIRIHGQDHEVFNNYIEAVDDNGINLEGGESEETPQPGTFHYRVYRAQVVNNTIIDIAKAGIQIGGVHPLSPVDCTIANNIVQSSTGTLIRESLQPVNTQYLANMVNPLSGATVGLSAGPPQLIVGDPKLVRGGEIDKLSAGSPAIGAAMGTFAFVTDDIDGDPRVSADIGADEYSTAPPLRQPLTDADVGPDAPGP
jgi:hypothetical protein